MRKVLLCNLNWHFPEDFKDFEIAGYRFQPIPARQPQHRTTYTPAYFDKQFRKHVVNAFALTSDQEKPSAIFEGRGVTAGRRLTFLDDLLAVTSILIGRNVQRWSVRKCPEFPLSAGNRLQGLARNSDDLLKHLQVAVQRLADREWRQGHDGGFHILVLLAAANVVNKELRFLAYMMAWEYVFFCRHRDLPEKELHEKALEQKLDYLIREYRLAERQYKRQVEKCGLFSRLRHQVAHGGIFRVSSLPGVLQNASPRLCLKYIELFEYMTENLVLKTLGIEGSSESWALNELLERGSVAGYLQSV